MFTKIGNDIINKGNNANKVNNSNTTRRQNSLNKTNQKGINNGNSSIQNVIQNLMEVTKENNIISTSPNRLPVNSNSNNNNVSIGQDNYYDTQQIINTENNDGLMFNPLLWDCLLEMELVYDQKNAFTNVIHKLINLLSSKLSVKEIPLNLFTVPQLNLGYSKLIKISFIFIVYLKYILLDFNYDVALKSLVKKSLYLLNTYLIQVIEYYIYQKDNTITFSNDLNDKYIKICKMHRHKKPPSIPNPVQYGTTLHKNADSLIANIKQISNTYFKIGYFKPIHTICFDFFRLIDTYTPYNLANLIVNHVLFFVMHNNPNDKNNNTISNKNIVFNPTNLLSLFGFSPGNLKGPFLPSDLGDPNKYTLVLDLDETLVHFFYTPSGGAFLIRPHCFEFLEDMSHIFDIAIFTAAMKDYADSILDILDPEKKWIKYRLYRHHTSISGMCFVKDLSKIGRDLKRVIIIDNIADNFKLQPNNGLGIKTWNEEMRDTQLVDIGKLLKDLISKKPNDIRVVFKKVKEEVTKRMRKNQMNPYRNIPVDKYI